MRYRYMPTVAEPLGTIAAFGGQSDYPRATAIAGICRDLSSGPDWNSRDSLLALL